MSSIARFTNSQGDFVGLLINKSANVIITESTILSDTHVIVHYNGTKHTMNVEYSIEEVVEIIESAGRE